MRGVREGGGALGPAGPHEPSGLVAGEWERLLTSGFLHMPPTEGTFGLLHIVLNMVALWQLGRVVEPMLGRLRFGALYGLTPAGE